MKTCKAWLAAAALMAITSATYATPVFQGRLADGSASSTCTVSGATKCTSFYDANLDITILNNWNIGRGPWRATAAAGSAQALAESAGFAATGLTGWVLPTGDATQPAGAANQLKSIFIDAGGSAASLAGQFDGVQIGRYWSSSVALGFPNPGAWYLSSDGTSGGGLFDAAFYAVAVRPGDVVASVPEPQTLSLAVLALGAAVVARKRRPR